MLKGAFKKVLGNQHAGNTALEEDLVTNRTIESC